MKKRTIWYLLGSVGVVLLLGGSLILARANGWAVNIPGLGNILKK